MRRIGSTPQERGSATGQSCPDVIELDDGAGYLVIGRMPDDGQVVDVMLAVRGADVGPGESAVIVPRDCLLAAARQLAGEDAGGHDGRHAYEAYSVVAEMLKPGEEPVQPWDDLPVKTRAAWVNAATGVYIRSRLAAADKARAWAEKQYKAPAPGLDAAGYGAVLNAVGLFDPRDPRSLDSQ